MFYRVLNLPLLPLEQNLCGSSRSQMFFKVSVLGNFAIFTEKHLYWSLFFNNVSGIGTPKETPTQMFSVNIAKFLRAGFFIEHLWWLLLPLLPS